MAQNLGFPLETVVVFVLLSVGAIVIDLYAHRGEKALTLKNASMWSVFLDFGFDCVWGLFVVASWRRSGQSVFHGLCVGKSVVGG